MGSPKVYPRSPETTCRTIFALWMNERERKRKLEEERSGGNHWMVWKGLKRGAMAEVLRQLATGKE
jgi:hypothetical protein